MRVALARRASDEVTVTLAGRATFPDGPLRLRYATRTGALLRVDGIVRGAFDGKHAAIDLPPLPGEHEMMLEVERRSLPVAGLPAGDGLRWRLMLARAAQRPADHLDVETRDGARGGTAVDVPLIGHAHLDVAWLWTYDAARRKALRTFATALREMDADPRYVYAQSQAQLYAWVFADEPELGQRVRALAAANWDASVATMWVEPDLHAPSGESVLRQFAHGVRWAREHLGVEPTVAWLPDSFGFPSTFPLLAAHAGVPYFATTKLQWNETTRWPYPRFRWRAPDGSSVIAAVLDSYDGELSDARVKTARDRDELLVVGFGDGGGGATDADLARVADGSRGWTRVGDWFANEVAPGRLPEHGGELYLETHRGTYTTHHDIKARNAELERALARAEELAAWCVAVRAPAGVRRALADDLRNAWRIVLRGQFHDVITGASIGAVYTDLHVEYDRARAIAARVAEAAASVLPRSDVRLVAPQPLAPVRDGDAWAFENPYVRAQVRDDGTIVELRGAGGPNLVALANGVVAYVDRPKRWDAWNLDAGYVRKTVRVRPDGASLEEGALVVRLAAGKSRLSMRVALLEDEPWLRVECFADWREDHVLLRTEHRIALHAREVRYGEQHGTIARSAYPSTDAERAKFEVPGQRWAHVSDGEHGLAVFTPDLYGWNAVGLKDGGVRLGTSLLRAPRWPDPLADRGPQRLEYAFVPTSGAPVSALEHAWRSYTTPEEPVRLFTCDDSSVLIVATYPSDDGSGVIVRVRECDGHGGRVALRCGGRMREAIPVDAVERPVPGDAQIAEEELLFDLGPLALRSFLVRF